MLPGEHHFRSLTPFRALTAGVLAACLAACGCNAVPMSQYRQAQFQTQALSQQLSQTQQGLAQVSAQNQQLLGEVSISQQRLANLQAERQELHAQYENLLVSQTTRKGPLSGDAARRFEELTRRYPQFVYDPESGVARFEGDLLFQTGSADVQNAAKPVLQELVQILNTAEAYGFDLLVVGHTDDRRVVQAATKAKHGTNWDLSAHRATAVVKQLASLGIDESRLGIAGYSMYQPVAANDTEDSRQQNRRVEIFIVDGTELVANLDRAPRF